jgi:hypothetical protein
MPTAKTITVYTFDELDDIGKEKAIEKLWDLNVDYNWWEDVYEDAARVGVEINGFDTYHSYHQKTEGRLTMDLLGSVNSIHAEHDVTCDTYKTATEYRDKYMAAYQEWVDSQAGKTIDGEPVDTELYDFSYEDVADEITEDYRKAILEDYLAMLRREYDYQTSSEAIIESIQANEYLFTENGRLA